MDSDERSFLAQILAHPADDVARLVYADWLDEQDPPQGGVTPNTDRAEFIRVQIELARMSPPQKIIPLEMRFPHESGFDEVSLRKGSLLRLEKRGPRGAPRAFAVPPPDVRVALGEVIDLVVPGGDTICGAVVRVVRLAEGDSDLVGREIEIVLDGRDHFDQRDRFNTLSHRERVLLCHFPAAPYWGLPDSLIDTHPHRDITIDSPAIRCHGRRVREVLFAFCRGFAAEVASEFADWLSHADASTTAQPIERVRLTTLPTAHVPDFNALRNWKRPLEWGGDLCDSICAEWPRIAFKFPHEDTYREPNELH